MTRLVILLVISCLATVAPAAVKRDEFGGANPTADHPNSSSGQNYQAGTSGSSQGNLYYYYYPVGDKGKEHGYQASSSNQFTSSVTPGNSNSGSSESGSPHTSALETPTNGQDLSYSAQDLSYSAQNLGSQAGNLGQGSGASGVGDYSNQAVGSSNYDQLSSIASQLQQYGFGSGSSGNSAFAPSSSAGYSPSGSSYNSGNSYSLNNDASGAGYSSGSGSGPSSSAFPGSVGDASGYSSSGPVPGFNGPTGSGAPGGYGGQPGSIPYSSQGNYNPYQAHGGYDSYNAAASSNHAQYEPPASGYRRYGIGSAILPILALAGLSLLIPTVTSLSTAATGRKRRSIDSPAKDSGLGAYFDRIERYYSLYKNAVEREECMNRILCELGDAMSNVRGKSTLFNVMEKVAPTWMNNKVGALKSGAISAEYGKCKKYTCQ